ncbi:putative C6 transcription factor [Aspergillus lucknowensis]|uniref:Transcription factor domain-containing protein n=1 Tax=Aspergillus lucknowensis TaxID=176173 RepID=A0ABR4LKL3_9EURO
MDSNLTLAHITHNTAVILLHQAIAYPPHHWKSSPVRLPSSSSAETCIEAATEISVIGQQFLLCSSMLTNPQFSFCLFIAGRMLLAHSKYNGVPIPGALDTLIASLFEISGRWTGPREVNGPETENLASVFAKRLVQARDNVSPLPRGSLSLDIRQTVYSGTEDVASASQNSNSTDAPAHPQGRGPGGATTCMPIATATAGPSMHPSAHPNNDLTNLQHPPAFTLTPDPALTLAFPPLPLSFQQNFAPFADTDIDPFNLQLGTPGMRDQDTNGWSGMPDSSFYPRVPAAVPVQDGYRTANGNVNGPTSGSPASAEALSPGQRISRFGGVVEDAAPGGVGS